MATAACPETKLFLPQNNGSSCWWLALNFALFHLERPEIEVFLKKKDEDIITALNYESFADKDKKAKKQAAIGEVITMLKKTIRYYKGEGTQDEASSKVIDGYRRNEKMATIFNDEGMNTASGKSIFKMAGGGDQDTSEWFLLLNSFFDINYINADLLSANFIEATFLSSFFPKFKIDDGNLVADISRLKDSPTLVVLINRTQIKDKLGADGKPELDARGQPIKVADQANPNKAKVPIQRFIMLPIITGGTKVDSPVYSEHLKPQEVKLNQYELDGIVEGRPGHFNALVKCTGSDSWIKYGSMASGNPTIAFADFNDMKAKYNTLETNDVILVYHLVKTVETQTANPTGLQKSVLEEASSSLITQIEALEDKEITIEIDKGGTKETQVFKPNKEEKKRELETVKSALQTNPLDIDQISNLRGLFSTISGYRSKQK